MKLALALTKPRPTVSSVHGQCYLKLPTVLLQELGVLLAHIATARETNKGLSLTVYQFRGYFYKYMAVLAQR